MVIAKKSAKEGALNVDVFHDDFLFTCCFSQNAEASHAGAQALDCTGDALPALAAPMALSFRKASLS
jgi:hypothetical protein